MFHGICWIAIHFFVVVTFPLCALSSMGVNILGRYHSVRSILKFMLYFQNVLCGSWQRIYLLEFNSGTVKGVIFLDMNDPMTFQTDSDLIKYVLLLSDILGSYAVKILFQAHVTSMLLFGICIGRTKVAPVVRIDHNLNMWWKSISGWVEDSFPNYFEESMIFYKSSSIAAFRSHPPLRVLSMLPSQKIHLMSWIGRLRHI